MNRKMIEPKEVVSMYWDDDSRGGWKRSNTTTTITESNVGGRLLKRKKVAGGGGSVFCRLVDSIDMLKQTVQWYKLDTKEGSGICPIKLIWQGTESMFTSVVGLGGCIYSLGGHREVGPLIFAPSDRACAFRTTDPDPIQVIEICSMVMPRGLPKTVAVSEENKIYVFGGFESSFFTQYFEEEQWAEFYDARTNKWKLLPPVKLSNGSHKCLYSILNPNPNPLNGAAASRDFVFNAVAAGNSQILFTAAESPSSYLFNVGHDGDLELCEEGMLPPLNRDVEKIFHDSASVDFDPVTKTLFGVDWRFDNILAYSLNDKGGSLLHFIRPRPFYEGFENDYSDPSDYWQAHALVRGSALDSGHIEVLWYGLVSQRFNGYCFLYSRTIKVNGQEKDNPPTVNQGDFGSLSSCIDIKWMNAQVTNDSRFFIPTGLSLVDALLV